MDLFSVTNTDKSWKSIFSANNSFPLYCCIKTSLSVCFSPSSPVVTVISPVQQLSGHQLPTEDEDRPPPTREGRLWGNSQETAKGTCNTTSPLPLSYGATQITAFLMSQCFVSYTYIPQFSQWYFPPIFVRTNKLSKRFDWRHFSTTRHMYN